MEVFWRLLFAHLLADFTFQTDGLVKWKKENHYGVMLHSAVFMVVSYVVCWNILTAPWKTILGFSVAGWIGVLGISAAHFYIDRYKVDITKKNESMDNLGSFLLDQLAHFMFIALFIAPSAFTGLSPSKLWILGSILIFVTHFAAILIYYIRIELYGKKQTDSEKKYVLMADRLVITLSFLIESWLFVILPLIWIGRTIILKNRKHVDYSWMEISTGYIISVVMGILARIIYFI